MGLIQVRKYSTFSLPETKKRWHACQSFPTLFSFQFILSPVFVNKKSGYVNLWLIIAVIHTSFSAVQIYDLSYIHLQKIKL